MAKYFGQDVLERLFLGLKHIESSDGKDLNHPVLKSGLHKGYSAEGELGMMPITSKEYAEKMLKEDIPLTPPEMMKNPSLVDFKRDEERMMEKENLSKLANFPLSPETQTEFKQLQRENPELYKKMARRILQTIANKTGADEEKAIVNWHEGQNKTSTSKEDVESDPRVAKYRAFIANKLGRTLAGKEKK